VVFWEMNSRATKDATFPVLDNDYLEYYSSYAHGGNEAISSLGDGPLIS
jgi:hypothetical protein